MATVESTLKGINRSSLTNKAEMIECQELINARYKNGKWQNVKGKTNQFTIGSGIEAMCVHNTNSGSFIVVYHEPTGKIKQKQGSVLVDIFTLGTSKQVRFETIGNILIVFDDSSKKMHYILYDIEINNYRYVGDAVPKPLEINFHNKPNSAYLGYDNFKDYASWLMANGVSTAVPVGRIDYDSSSDERYDQIMTVLDIAYNNWEKEGMINGYVVIRYAYELFDGSIVGHSKPIIMHIRGQITDKYDSSSEVQVAVFSSNDKVFVALDPGTLQYSIPSINSGVLEELNSQYKGLVMGVNIYMSRVYHRIKSYNNQRDDYYYGRSNGGNVSPWELNESIEDDENITPDLMIKDTQLYKVHTIPLDDLDIVSPTTISLGDITAIHTKDSMPTEQLSDIRMYASSSFIYNSRLWMGGIINYFSPVPKSYNTASYPGGVSKTVWFEFILKTSVGNIHLRSDGYANSDTHLNLPFCIYYPDSRAVKFNILVKPDGGSTYIAFSSDMTPHPSFNYSFSLMGYQPDIDETIPTSTTRTSGERTRHTDYVRMSWDLFNQMTWKYPTVYTELEIASDIFINSIPDNNRIQVSAVNNPLYFEAKNSYRVGNGSILQLISNSKPLSALQYGQHPMIVFTTTGVFALEIGTGEVMVLRVIPVTDEVVVGKATSYNGRILFPTDKGIISLYGESFKLISNPVNGPVSNNLVNNDLFNTLMVDLFGNDDALSQVDFLTYLKGSTLAVDYINEELIVSNPTYQYSYIFGFDSGLWYKRSESFDLMANNWPNTYALISRNNSVDLVELGKESINLPVLLISRPCGFGNTDEKKVNRAVLREVITGNNGRITTLLYGQLNEEGLIFLNNGKSFIQSSVVDVHITKTQRSCRYTVLVHGCKPTLMQMDRLDTDLTTTWNG